MGLIYMATNKVNGKSYIGLTTGTLENRRKQHENSINNKDKIKTYFQKSLLKYGIENFNWVILEDNINTYDELNERETYFISKYDTFNKGYNMTLGGTDCNPNKIYSDEEIKEIIWYICETNLSYSEIAFILNYTPNMVMDIAYKRYRVDCWKGKDNPRYKNKIKEYKDEYILMVIKVMQENIGKRLKDIEKEHNIPYSLIYRIYKGYSYTDLWDRDTYIKQRKIERKKVKKVKRNKYGKLNEDDYIKLKNDIISTDLSYNELAKRYCVSSDTVSCFANKKIYKEVWGDDINPRTLKNRKYTKDECEVMYRLYYLEGKSLNSVMKEVKGRSKSPISNFLKGKSREEWFKEFEEKYGKGVRE